MKLLTRSVSGIAAAACFLALSASAFAATHKPIVASARDFIGGFSTDRKTERVAANQQRSFIVSASKAAALFDQAESVVLSDFPVTPFSNAVVELDRSRPIIDGETVFMRNGKPVDDSFAPMSVQTFRGKIRGEAHSKVIVSIIDGNIVGAVQHDDGERYIFSPLDGSKKDAREHTLFAESGVAISPEELSFTCMTPDVEQKDSHSHSKRTSKDRTLSNELLEFKIAVETDHGLYTRFGGDTTRMQQYVYSLMAMVSSIYEDEINVTFVISYFGFWSEPDPYEADGDIGEMLGRFSDYWRQNMSHVKRSIAHLVTGPGSTRVGGIAFIDQLCNTFLGYSVSGVHSSYTFPTTSYTWDVNVVAHELGHNFSSPHTHVCDFWGFEPLDTCVSFNPKGGSTADDACLSIPPVKSPGSIMSYCHLINGKVNLTFTPPVIQVIRNGAEMASCLTAPTKPTILLQNPLGNQMFATGSKIDIRWTSARLSMVGIEYSSDGGQHWTNIVESIPSSTRKFEWTLPLVESPTMLVRIYSVNDPSINDASIVTFNVSKPVLAISYPTGGERFARKAEIMVKWDKVLVPSVALDFSSDNGVTWQTEITGITSKEYKWTIPSVLTSQGIVRLRDESNNEMISQTAPFTIAPPVVQLVAPAGGVQWAAGSQQEIRWQSDLVEKIKIDYKVPNKDWKNIGPLLITASTGTFTWTVPNDITEDALVRIRVALLEDGPADTSDTFAITGTVDVNEPGIIPGTFSIAPQPANDHIMVSFALVAPSRVRIAVVDVTGRTVAEVLPEQSATGSYNVSLPTAALAQGVYFVTIETGSATITRTLTVLH